MASNPDANLGEFQNFSATTISFSGNEDQPASLKDDQLGFKPYVEAVYSFLKHPSTKPPFTLSLEGEWGSGKSSFLLQLEQALEKDKAKTVHFNAWMHDKVESMWAAFALHFIKELSLAMVWWKRPWAFGKILLLRYNIVKGWPTLLKTILLLLFYGFLLYQLGHVINSRTIEKVFNLKEGKLNETKLFSVLGWAGTLIIIIMIIKKISEVTGNPFTSNLKKYVVTPNYEGNSDFLEAFHRDFGKLVKVLAEDKEKIFVFIDDLDRADIPKATELMQGLNMMIADTPQLIFIIAMNKEKVAAGIAYKYKDLLPFLNTQQEPLTTKAGIQQAREFGYSYLEKFIQLSLYIPKPSAMFMKQFIQSLSNKERDENNINSIIEYKPILIVEDGQDSQEFREVTLSLARFFDNNPRRLKQFVNAFRLKAHIANSTGLFDANKNSEFGPMTIPQLGKFVALTLKWPRLIDDLLKNNLLLDHILQEPPDGSNDTINEWVNNTVFLDLLKLVPDSDNFKGDNSYHMQNVNIRALIETSPAVNNESTQNKSDKDTVGNSKEDENRREGNSIDKSYPFSSEASGSDFNSQRTEILKNSLRNTPNA